MNAQSNYEFDGQILGQTNVGFGKESTKFLGTRYLPEFTFNKEIDKQIADAVIDDSEKIRTINDEIDSSRTVRGQFQTTEVEGETVGEET